MRGRSREPQQIRRFVKLWKTAFKIHTSLLPPEQFWSDRNKTLMSQFTAGMPDVLVNAEDLV